MKKYVSQLKMIVFSFMLMISFCFVLTDTADAASLNKKKVTIYEGKTATLKVKSPAKKVKWTTSNKKVVSIKKTSGSKKQNAVVLGKKKGKATVKATYKGVTLKATVTVKHKHKYTIPATCTKPSQCACGNYNPKYDLISHNFTGPACSKKCSMCGAAGASVPHNMSSATCVKKSTCTYCGMTSGGFGAHSYNSEATCTLCNRIELYRIIDIWNTYSQSSVNFATIRVQNNSRVDNLIIGSTSVMGGLYATITLPGIGTKRALLDQSSGYSTNIYLPGQQSIVNGEVRFQTYFDFDSATTIPVGSKAVFYIQFKNHVYEITASSDALTMYEGKECNYTYKLIK